MKQFGKLLCLLLALLMVLSLTTTAFATGETGSITIDNPQEGQTYTAYKIFDVTYDTGKTHYSYTIDSTSEWFSTVQGYANTSANGLTLTNVSGTTTYIVKKENGFSAAAFAEELSKSTTDKTGNQLEIPTGQTKPTKSGLELGYYFVTSTGGALCNLTTTNPNVIVSDKNDIPFSKVDNKGNVEIGEEVTYTITGKVPDTTGFNSFDYVITDKMSAGLTLNADSIHIYTSNNGTYDPTQNYDTLAQTYYTLNTTDPKAFGNDTEAVSFRIDFKPIAMNNATPTMHGKYIFITYTATVNENAVAVISNNEAKLTYSNDPTDNAKHDTRTDKETVYTAKIVIDKYEIVDPATPTNNTTKKLNGAKFILYRQVTTGSGATTNEYYKYDSTNDKVTWVTGKNDATEVTTDTKAGATTKGYAEFNGLKDGTYYLLETAAPAGYNPLQEPVQITINGATATETDLTSLTHTEEVGNNTGAELPGTGGMGTTLFYIFGSILVVCAGVLLVTRKRMSVQG